MSPGRLNAVPSQHCSPEALRYFGDKHCLAVKRATEEKAYQMSSQWAVSCIMRPGPQIRWSLEFDARLQNSVPQCCCVIRLRWNSAASPNSAGEVLSGPYPLFPLLLPSRNERLELRQGERAERGEKQTEGRRRGGSLAFRFCPCPFSCSAFWG